MTDRTTHRLEAFSDIVIGFNLAQLGLSLVIPTHPIDFVARPAGIFAFVVTFVVVVRFWWINHLIFDRYFRPTRIMIALNFITLAFLILQVFSLQLYLHFVPLGEGGTASRIYFAFFALSYGIQGLMLAIGLRYRWSELSSVLRRNGIAELIGRFCIVAGATIGNLIATKDVGRVIVEVQKQDTLVATLPSTLLLGAFAGALVGALGSFAVKRWGDRAAHHMSRPSLHAD